MSSVKTATADPLAHLCDQRARTAADLFGDVAVVTRVREEEDLLVTVVVHHRNQAHLSAARKVLGERYRRGEALPGRVWESERGILLVDVDDPALASAAPMNSSSQAYVLEVGIRSMMIVPLWKDGVVVGTLGVARDPGGDPYTEEDFARLQTLAAL